jgi:hypothetical protein
VADEDETMTRPKGVLTTVRIPGAPSVITAMMPSFSYAFFLQARRLAEEAEEAASAPPNVIILPMAAVLLAATSLESFLSEEIEFALKRDPSIAARAKALREQRSLKLVEKWTQLLQLHSGTALARDREPCQSFALLVELRNVLVHAAGRFRELDEFPSEGIQSLQTKFEFSPHPPGEILSWERLVLNAHCARWAVNTAAKMVVEHRALRTSTRKRPAFQDNITWKAMP